MSIGVEASKSAKFGCESCGRPFDLRCEDCGCLVSSHDLIYPRAGERLPYCMWDFGPCPKEQRPVFFTAVEAWLREREPQPLQCLPVAA